MPLTLQLPPDIERKLKEVAADQGQDPADFALRLLEESLALQSRREEASEDLLAAALEKLTHRAPEEVAAAQERARDFIRPGRPLPPGESLVDGVAGKWPGEESDHEVAEALRRLS